MAWDLPTSTETDADSPGDETFIGKLINCLSYLKGLFHQTTGHKHTGAVDDAPPVSNIAQSQLKTDVGTANYIGNGGVTYQFSMLGLGGDDHKYAHMPYISAIANAANNDTDHTFHLYMDCTTTGAKTPSWAHTFAADGGGIDVTFAWLYHDA